MGKYAQMLKAANICDVRQTTHRFTYAVLSTPCRILTVQVSGGVSSESMSAFEVLRVADYQDMYWAILFYSVLENDRNVSCRRLWITKTETIKQTLSTERKKNNAVWPDNQIGPQKLCCESSASWQAEHINSLLVCIYNKKESSQECSWALLNNKQKFNFERNASIFTESKKVFLNNKKQKQTRDCYIGARCWRNTKAWRFSAAGPPSKVYEHHMYFCCCYLSSSSVTLCMPKRSIGEG